MMELAARPLFLLNTDDSPSQVNEVELADFKELLSFGCRLFGVNGQRKDAVAATGGCIHQRLRRGPLRDAARDPAEHFLWRANRNLF